MAFNVGTAVGYLDLDTTKWSQGFQSATQSLNEFNSSSTGALNGAASALSSAGSSLTKKVTLPIVGLGTAVVKTTADFESAMSEVKAISGATGSDFDALKDKAEEMGAKTKFSASESAAALKYMAMAGWKTEDMLAGIEGVMNLAAASGEDLATTSDIVTDALTAFGLTAEDTQMFVDTLAAAATNSNTNVSMLGESFKYVAPLAGTMGYSVQDVSVALGTMANSGIKASQAGTTLRTLISNMASPTDTMAAAMDKLGLSLSNTDGTTKSLAQIMDDLRTSFAGIRNMPEEYAAGIAELDEQLDSGAISMQEYEAQQAELARSYLSSEEALKAKYASDLAGARGLSGVMAIVNATESDFNTLTQAINDSSGTAEEMSATMLDNLNGRMTILKSTLEGVAISFGELLIPVIEKVVGWLQEFLNWINNLDEGTKETIIKIAAALAVLGPVLLVVGKALSVISTVSSLASKGFGLVKVAIGGLSAPIVGIVAAIGTLVAAFMHLWNTNEEFRANITAIWENLKETFSGFADGIVERLNSLGFDFQNIGEVLSAVWNGFCELLAPVFEGAFGNIVTALSTAFDVILGIFDFFKSVFTGDWEGAWEAIKGIFTSIWDGIVSIFTGIWDTIKGIIDTVLGWFGTSLDELWEGIKTWFSNLWDGIKDFFSNIWGSITGFFSNVWDGITGFFSNIWDGITGFFKGIWDKITTAFSNALSGIGDFVGGIIDWFMSIPKKVVEIGKNIVEGLWEGIKNAASWLWDKITGWLDGIWSGIKGFFGIKSPSKKMAEIGKYTVQGMAKGITDTAQEATDAALSVAESVADALSEPLSAATTLDIGESALEMSSSLTPKQKSRLRSTAAGGAGSTETTNNYNFYSPTAVTPTVAAKMMKQTAQQMAMAVN